MARDPSHPRRLWLGGVLASQVNIRKGDMFEHQGSYEVILVTTNATVRKDGALVMGRGAALTAAERYPFIPKVFGNAIKDRPDYAVVIPYQHPTAAIFFGAFQVKRHWRDMASLDLIYNSAYKLAVIAETFPNLKFAVNFPGIGNGRLSREEVLPMIRRMPDNVDVWEL